MAFATTRIQLCGRFTIEDGDAKVESRLPGRQGRLLLAYLVANWDRSVTRDELAFAVWGDELPSDLDGCLNALLSKVRRVAGPTRLVGRSELRFVGDDDTFVDVHSAIDALHRAEGHAAAGRWQEGWQPAHTAYQIARRQFMLGLDNEWVDEWRRRLDDVTVRGLECHIRCQLRSTTDMAAVERVARSLVERAPFRESGYALLMEALARQGNPAEALRIYDGLSRLLGDELGIAPGAAVTTLRDQLLDAEPRRNGQTISA